MLTASSTVVLGQSSGQEADPPPIGGAISEYYTVGDINGDGLYDVVRAITSSGIIEVWKGEPDDTLTLQNTYSLQGASAVTLGDLDADGKLDLVAGSKSQSSIFYGLGNNDFMFLFASPIFVGIGPGVVTVADTCVDLLPEILLSNDQLTTNKMILDVLSAPSVLTVTSETPITCPEQLPPPCGAEPACNPAPAFPGIQECLRAADCRRQKCHWAACVNCHDGNGCSAWERIVWVGANLACAYANQLEVAGCVGAALP